MNKVEGRVAWKFDDHFDVDLIVGVHYIHEKNIEKLVPVGMKDFDPNFISNVKPGDILVAGRNLGYGHPHPQGMKVMRHLGIRTVIAKSFARVFFKNEIAAGMMLFPCPDLPGDIDRWEQMSVDLDEWTVTRMKTGERFKLAPIPAAELSIIKAGGIVPYLKGRENE